MSPKVELVRSSEHYDCIIVVCGYERRSSFMINALAVQATQKIAFGYGTNEVIAFQKNRATLTEAGFEFVAVEDERFAGELRDRLQRCKVSDRRTRVLIDISCFTRFRLACLITCFMEMTEVDVDFFYSLASYSPPLPDEPISEHIGPATEYLSGWSGEYTYPTVVVSGLGYEHMKALGVIELLDPSGSWLFFPRSPIRKYDEAVRSANDLLLRDVDPSRVIEYDVLNAPALVRDLFSLLSHLRTHHRCVLLPLGPKIFAFCAMLAGAHFRDIAVWRVSAGKYAKPTDRAASKEYTIFRVSFDFPRCTESTV